MRGTKYRYKWEIQGNKWEVLNTGVRGTHTWTPAWRFAETNFVRVINKKNHEGIYFKTFWRLPTDRYPSNFIQRSLYTIIVSSESLNNEASLINKQAS